MKKRRENRPGALKETSFARDLPTPSAGLELDARCSQRLTTAETLKVGRTPLQLVEVADGGARMAEETVRKAREADRPPPAACKEGCDWCCHLRVGTAIPEVVRILEYLRQTLTAEEWQAMRERVAWAAEQRRQVQSRQRADPRLPCPLLVNRRCSAYPVRPLTCRGFNSRDASRCELFVKAKGGVTIPMYHPQQRVMTFTLDGTRAGLTEAGLKGDVLELTAALHIGLEAPDAVERWLAGDSIFAAARLERRDSVT
jgi:Fe-S-cluster containining protein